MDQYAVFGNPVAHSKSPFIHRWFAAQTGEAVEYTAQLVVPEGFAHAAQIFFSNGGKGLNITVPFKQDAWHFADHRSPHAERAGAVNTLAMQANGQVLGANTDGIGLLRDIHSNLGWPIRGKRLLLIGAGGAARGVLQPLLEAEPKAVTIVNRTPATADALAREFSDLGPVTANSFSALEGQQFDLLINATAASLHGDLPALPDHILSNDACAYDMLYAATTTPFNAWARQNGAREVADGLGMLVEQAAESFAIWGGVRPDTEPLLAVVRAELQKQKANS